MLQVEAAKHVSRDLRESHPQVPWSAAARMRSTSRPRELPLLRR